MCVSVVHSLHDERKILMKMSPPHLMLMTIQMAGHLVVEETEEQSSLHY